MFPDDRLPTRWDLDEATRVHPVLVQHMSGHHALANTIALEHRGVTDAAADPDGGRLVRDDRGRITGYCLDAAQALVVPIAVDIAHHGPGFHDDAPLDEIVGDIDRAFEPISRPASPRSSTPRSRAASSTAIAPPATKASWVSG